ncbi:unnamed protein product [Arabis nemorensis]|uniref:Uncharacterized protein n=1 Tax=Arabis nemorensis TaxID=586526 RepID=A0A565C4T9_9BRAS|nr:unnamed protein product [Arabis nemorensis]
MLGELRMSKNLEIAFEQECKTPDPFTAKDQCADTYIKRDITEWIKLGEPPQNVLIVSSDSGFQDSMKEL